MAGKFRPDGKPVSWFKGSTSSCRRHIASAHFKLYQKRCAEKGLEEKQEAVPKKIWAARVNERIAAEKEAKSGKAPAVQTTLDSAVRKMSRPKEFSRMAILFSVAQHIVMANKVCTHQMLEPSSRLCFIHWQTAPSLSKACLWPEPL